MGAVKGCMWAFIWFLLLIFLAWPVAIFCAFWYIILSPFGACIDGCSPLTDLLERGLKLNYTCAKNMVARKEGLSLEEKKEDFGGKKESLEENDSQVDIDKS